MNKEILQLLQATINSFNTNQTKSLEIFERYMNDQNRQSQQLLNILSQHLSGGNGNMVQTPIKTETPLNTTSPETTCPFNGGNGASVTPISNDTKVHADAPIVTPTAPASNGIGLDIKLTTSLLQVVSEKTGYPAEMLELSMNMEADLGIDSIKRVEIFGALTNQYPEMSGINPNELTELRTLGEIIDFVSAREGAAQSNGVETTLQKTTPITAPIAVVSKNTPSSNGGLDINKLTTSLLQVVSEKTGYPAEMLELSMNMEADLGIDSIKRVEIFGALTNQYPEMSGINPNELTELQTLGEIVDFVSAREGAAQSNGVETTLQKTTPITAPIAVVSKNTPSSNGGLDINKLTSSLLQVVSEKTGYPAEMLELSMNMEADLGIDSIKRVEIFGALTNQYPEMSGINPNELTELRTLGEIVDFVGAREITSQSNGVETTLQKTTPITAPIEVVSKNTPSSNGGLDINKLTISLLQVVSEKTGYPAEMLELSMNMEADLGIDSIKRVEIFGALTNQYPEMSGINPNELTELRTLGEIVDFVGARRNHISKQ